MNFKKFLFIFIVFVGCMIGCDKNVEIRTGGDAAQELTILVPGDKVVFDSGDAGYVNAEGYFVGVQDMRILAAGRKLRDIAVQIRQKVLFYRYELIERGERYIEVVGAVQFPQKYKLPADEQWNMMNILLKVEGFTGMGRRQYLVVRKIWGQKGRKHVFIRGVSVPELQSIGGEDLLLFSHDRIIFPGSQLPIYVFGSVQSEHGGVCFGFNKEQKPDLSEALKQAGGIGKYADKDNITVYRMLRRGRRSVFRLSLANAKKFPLQPWDVIHIPSKVPSEILQKDKS